MNQGAPGATLVIGPYTVLSPLGAGGMGEVYRARDSRLDRDVAIKILPAAFAADAERVARFHREAKTLASLSHPNIGAIHGIEESDGIVAIVMELVEGEDLAQRIARGPIELHQVLPIARQIAEALDAAHGHGVIHRDLKPANIRIRPDGTVKVLDFGLAKTGDVASSAANVSNSPTTPPPAMTEPGIILGTAAYMSPEQARGTPVDSRTDIWAFGCVLYEMLTGRRAFAGDNVSDVLASVLAREPALAALPDTTPPSIRRLLQRCLQKNRVARLRDIGDARFDIADATANDYAAGEPAATAVKWSRGVERLAWAAALVATVIAAITLASRRTSEPAELRVDLVTPPTAAPHSTALSPDGRTLAFIATSERESRLSLRSLPSGSSRTLGGTDGAELPFWSPDGQSIGFFAAAKLRRVEVSGGAVQTLATVNRGQGGTWNQDNVILFASLGNPIARIAASGGDAVKLSGLAQQGSDFSPHFLPDGRHFLYYVRGNADVRGVYLGELDSASTPRRLLNSDTAAVFAPPGHLLFVVQGTLLAQPFNLTKLELVGNPFAVAEHVARETAELGVTASRSGSIAYRESAGISERQLIWFDRAGNQLSTLGDTLRALAEPSLSPGGDRVAFYGSTDGSPDIWTMDTKRGVLSRLTSHPADDVYPIWSPDGRRVVFSSNRKGVQDVYVKPAAGDAEELLLASALPKVATDWSPDGRILLIAAYDPRGSVDIMGLSMDGSSKVFPVVKTPFDEQGAQFSPDGKWIAYQSNESGRNEIYVQSFPGSENRSPVSTDGGTQVRWGRNGKELFYISRHGQLMAVPFRSAANTPAADIGTPAALFAPPIGSMVQQGDFRHQFMVAPDGQRFLVATVKESSPSPVTLILNWKPPS